MTSLGDYHTVSTDDFWLAMRDPRFIRINSHCGQIDGKRIWCEQPPESVQGFISDRIAALKL